VSFLSIAFKVGAFAQTFNSPTLLPTAFDPVAVATGDFNHDGNPDLVYVDGAGQTQHTLHVLLGRGDGTFSHGQSVPLPAGVCVFVCTINVADISGDGLPDLIMGGGNGLTGEVAVLLGNADGTFQVAIVSTLPPSTQVFPFLGGVIAVGDFNGDGAPDLAVGDPSNSVIHVLLGDKSGHFTEATILSDDSRSADLHAIDLNHDGHLDLVALGNVSAGGFNVFFGNGDGTFQFPVLHVVGAGFKGFLRDVDGDGQPDILAQLNTTGTVTQIIFLKGNPDGTFASAVTVGQLPGQLSDDIGIVTVGDFNGDGILDLEVTNKTGVGILLGQPGLIFGPMIKSLSGGTHSPFIPAPAQADLNKDGHLDLAIPSDGGIVLLMGIGDGSFLSGAQVYDVGSPVTTVAVADFNGDKLPDIAVAIDAAVPRLLLGQAGGSFVLAPDPNATHGSGPGGLAVGDFNGDGHADLLLGANSFAASPAVLFGDGHGNFSAPLTVPAPAPVVADFNGDGRSDTATINVSIATCFPGCPLAVSLGQTNNTFVTKNTTILGITDAILTAIGDLNGDGIPDVVLTGDGVLQVWLGNGDGTFTVGTSLNIASFDSGNFGVSSPVPSPRAALVDLDGDGKKDLVMVPVVDLANQFFVPPQALIVLYGKGDGTFESPVLVPLSHYYTQLTIADVNQDQRPDLILNDGVGIAVILNLGNRAFEDEIHYVAGTAIAGLTAVDVNGDGFPDLVVANPGGTTVAVLLNNPTGIPPGGFHPLASLSIAPEPSDFAAAFTATASVSAPNLNSPAPTGSVDFMLDGSLSATVPLSSGTASFTFTSSLTPGLHQVFATYSGDSAYAMASVNQPHTVNRQVHATTIILTAAPSAVLASQTVHLEATISAAGGATVCPPIIGNICSWGIVTFLEGTKTLNTQSADENGRAVFDTALLAPGTHTLSAVYHGFSNSVEIFPPTTSAPSTVVVSSLPTVTTASVSNTSITLGTVATISASVSSASGTPFGGATFFDGSRPLGTASLHADGTASFSTALLSAGTHTISANFNANATFTGSSSAPVTLVVNPPPAAAISTFAAFSTTFHPENGTVSFAVTVVAEHGSPQSTVVFLDGGVILGKAMTDPAGSAVLTIPMPGNGTHNFRASFSGDSQFAPSVSPEGQELWPDSGPGFSVGVDPVIVKFNGIGAEGAVSVTTANTLQDPIGLACVSGLPAGYSCSFEPSSLSQGGISRLSIRPTVVSRNTLPHTPASRKRSFNMLLRGLAFVAVFLVSLFVLPRRRIPALLALLSCVSLCVLSGCGGGGQQLDKLKVEVVTIQATSGTGQSRFVHSAQLILIVSDR
jgi:hypothetical protein